MAQKPETVFRHRVRRDLVAIQRRYYFWFEAIAQKAIHGTPDYLLCIGGSFLGLELKAENGKVSRIQEEKLKNIAKAGGISIVVKPSNWEDAKQLILSMAQAAFDTTVGGTNDSNEIHGCNGPELPRGGVIDLEQPGARRKD